jgi:hypothetical protein
MYFQPRTILSLLSLLPFLPTTYAQTAPPPHTPCADGDIALGQSQTCSWFPAGPANGVATWPDCNGNFGTIWDNNWKALSISWKEGICNGDWTEKGTYVACSDNKVNAVWVGDEKVQYVNCYHAKDGSSQYMGIGVKTTLNVEWCCRPRSETKKPIPVTGEHWRA